MTELGRFLFAQCQDANQKLNAISSRVGVSSLPDEILSEILILATRPRCKALPNEMDIYTEMDALQKAEDLSHVCRRFRSLVLGAQCIWNIISESMNKPLLKICAERSKQVSMDVLIESFGLHQTGVECFSTFFRTCLLSSARWGSLTIGSANYPHMIQPHRNWNTIRDNMLSVGRLSG